MYYRLSLLSFLVYSVPGAWMPLFALRLENELSFEPWQTALAFSGWAVGAIFASLAAGQIADRWLSLERCIAVCSFIDCLFMFSLSQSSDPTVVIVISVVMCLFLVPTMTLCLTYCLTHLENPELQFGRVRMWGTMGWMAPSFLLLIWYADPEPLQALFDMLGRDYSSYADTQRLAGVLALCLAVYACTLPYTPPYRIPKDANGIGRPHWFAPLGALHLLRRRLFAVFCLCAFLVHLTLPFFFQQNSLLLEYRGVPKEWIPPVLTIGQWSEFAMLFLLPIFSFHLGMQRTLLIGLIAWVGLLAALAFFASPWLIIAALPLNGVTISCYLIRGQAFIARQAGPDIRASAQGLVMMFNGIGLLLGNFVVGLVRELVNESFTLSFGVGAGIAVMTAVIFIVGFRESSAEESEKRGASNAAKIWSAHENAIVAEENSSVCQKMD